MSEIRKTYDRDTWVIIAADRRKRPTDFISKNHKCISPASECPFCPGNEKMTPPEVLAFRKKGTLPDTPGWWIRCIENKFPALKLQKNHSGLSYDDFYQTMEGFGKHEVIIETPEHDKHPATLPVSQVEEILRAYVERYKTLSQMKNIRYVLIFRNHKKEAGASLSHPHSQIIAMPILPKIVKEELIFSKRFYNKKGKCLYDYIISMELTKNERIIYETKDFIVFSPFASRYPFETWIIPKRHEPSFGNIREDERKSLASVLKNILHRYNKILADPPYNFYIHSSPCDSKKYPFYHWHLEITPRLTTEAGFERGSSFYINPMLPEDATKLLTEKNVM